MEGAALDGALSEAFRRKHERSAHRYGDATRRKERSIQRAVALGEPSSLGSSGAAAVKASTE